MKNKFQLLTVSIILFAMCLGCGFGSRASDNQQPEHQKTITDKAVDTTVGRSKIGVPECDEVMDAIETELNSSDDNFIVKAGKATVLNKIRDGIRESVEENKSDAVELAKTCREFKTEFDKYKAEEESNKSR